MSWVEPEAGPEVRGHGFIPLMHWNCRTVPLQKFHLHLKDPAGCGFSWIHFRLRGRVDAAFGVRCHSAKDMRPPMPRVHTFCWVLSVWVFLQTCGFSRFCTWFNLWFPLGSVFWPFCTPNHCCPSPCCFWNSGPNKLYLPEHQIQKVARNPRRSCKEKPKRRPTHLWSGHLGSLVQLAETQPLHCIPQAQPGDVLKLRSPRGRPENVGRRETLWGSTSFGRRGPMVL